MTVGWNRSSGWVGVLATALAVSIVPTAAARAEECSNGSFPSTFALIQKVIFENPTYSCTNDLCHGAALSGGLDLRHDVAYQNLVDVNATTVPGLRRVFAGEKEHSLLWINLAAKTDPAEWTAPLHAMPLDPMPALKADELEAVRLWIQKGAPEDGVIEGTDTLLNACLPPPEPIAIKPLPPPDPGAGVQMHMPKWILKAHSEREVCFASYYDVSAQVPPEFRGPDGTTFRYKLNTVRQDPQSHHLITNLYQGEAAPNDPSWGAFQCNGGTHDGESCDPTDLTFCGDGQCATNPVSSIACLGFGPPDAGLGINSVGFSGTQQTAAEFSFPEGVYRELPLKGMILWNSHAFNLTDTDGKLEAWLNFYFATPEEQKTPALQIFDTSEIFKMQVPAFSTEEVCSIHQLPPDTHLFELSSHGHKRMKRWRTFIGAYTCDGGSNAGQACDPFGADFASPAFCPAANCTSMTRPRSGDCNFDQTVTVDEVVTGVNVALEESPMDDCVEADMNGDGKVTIDEILSTVHAALVGVPDPVARKMDDSFVYVSQIYNDPIVERFDPPMIFSRPNGADRSLTYCALYDNGFTNPDEVKRKSTSPNPSLPVPGVGGPCQQPTNCVAGQVGAPCSGTTQKKRDQSCDSEPDKGDGLCDACPLRGGVTTEDEMFLLLGQFYVPGESLVAGP
jgi:hypothetical protein